MAASDRSRALARYAVNRPTWRLYLIASIANFATNALQLYQVTFTRPARTATPWTREYLYERNFVVEDQSDPAAGRPRPQSTLE